jgi:hypothetical protein
MSILSEAAAKVSKQQKTPLSLHSVSYSSAFKTVPFHSCTLYNHFILFINLFLK